MSVNLPAALSLKILCSWKRTGCPTSLKNSTSPHSLVDRQTKSYMKLTTRTSLIENGYLVVSKQYEINDSEHVTDRSIFLESSARKPCTFKNSMCSNSLKTIDFSNFWRSFSKIAFWSRALYVAQMTHFLCLFFLSDKIGQLILTSY